ncbi:5'(3')-deoxyribonucleotidase, mitochondrial-like [Ylistrum balloti]|uniref:5'(3')-deoxyribonucleotidase, mitochondrial-like n=1 Tax=Ylistrum balloti TaxID=509963 RepID=UPI002905D22B|nr:5'(3')-deoxyribonucleotidase, mitochondrial-like [Ylistrum balloti]
MAGRKVISKLMERRLRVLVDMDQTIADFEGYFLTMYRKKFPDEPYIEMEDRRTFYLGDQYEKLKEGLKKKVKSIYEAEGFFRDLPELPGACNAIKAMDAMEGVDVFLCTSPLFQYQYSVKEKYEWVENHLGPDFIEKVILTRDKTVINGHLLIDDRPDIKGACAKPTWEHILMDACHNKHMKRLKQRRLENWTDGSWQSLIEESLKRL